MTAALSCDGVTCPRLPPPWGSLKTKEAHDDEHFETHPHQSASVHWFRKWYRHGINRNVTFTDGAKFAADEGGAYWLLDTIAICQRHEKRVAGEEFQVWKLKVNEDRTATLVCDDGNDNIVYTQHIAYTDFPLDEITLYFVNNVIHLPSEY